MEIVIRGGNADDLNFVRSTWLKGLYYGNSYCSEIDQTSFFKGQGQIIADALLNPSNSLRVACLKEDPSVVLGYVLVGWNAPIAIHWVYVKSAFRKQGIANSLLSDVKADTVTSITDLGNKIRKTKGYKFNPYLV